VSATPSSGLYTLYPMASTRGAPFATLVVARVALREGLRNACYTIVLCMTRRRFWNFAYPNCHESTMCWDNTTCSRE